MSSQAKAGKPLVLIIRDGWGVSASPPERAVTEGNATLLAKTPVHDKILSTYPYSLIGAAGEAVGLPDGQMGNSEVGHLNIGAGRTVYQDFTRISLAVREGTFFEVPAFKDMMEKVKAANSSLHLIGLCSDGGVHSHLDHLFALIDLAKKYGIEKVLVHCLMDGRDTSPTSGVDFITQIQAHLTKAGVGRIATIIGRYYAMDRDNRWDRVEQGWKTIVKGEGAERSDPVEAMRQWYKEDKTDEFIPPTVIVPAGESAKQLVHDEDGIIFFNFRSDRAREITRALALEDFDAFERDIFPKVHYVCMTEYDETFKLPIAFPPVSLTNILAQVLADHGLKQLRIAETEKYAHVTFFFNGGEEKPFPGEDRCLIPSPKVATYDLKPEMNAPEVTDEVVRRIKSGKYDVIILNYANADMVGHTGIIPAAIKAVEAVDEGVGKVLAALDEVGGTALLTADHGNSEKLLDENGKPFTAHTTDLVHFILVTKDYEKWQVRPGILADIAPTMLQLLGLPKPDEMTGKSLVVPAESV
jgi:2,3-bisphosphoglycerate-independent phosphoglycerate mutase